MCQLLDVSRSGYYEWRKRPESERARRRREMIQRIYRIYVKSRRLYGSPKITHVLRKEGVKISQKTVSRLMQSQGLKSRTIRKYKATTNSKHNHPVQDNVLNQIFVAQKPAQIWMADITYGTPS